MEGLGEDTRIPWVKTDRAEVLVQLEHVAFPFWFHTGVGPTPFFKINRLVDAAVY